MSSKEPPSSAAELRLRAEVVLQEPAGSSPASIEILSPAATLQMLHELRAQQIELELQNEELRLAQLARSRYFELYDLAPVGYVTVNQSGLILQANLTAASLLGAGRAGLVQQPLDRFFATDTAERFDLLRKQLLATGEPHSCELRVVRSDGSLFYAHLAASAAVDESGEPIFYLTLSDITEQKRAEESLQIANQKLRLHFEQTPMAVIEWDLHFRVTQWNPAAQAIFGFSRDEAIGQHASFVVPEAFRQHVDEVWQALLSKRGGVRSSNENIRKDGRTIFCEWYNTPLIDERGAVAGVASVVMDITAGRQSQQLLAWEKSALELIGSPGSLTDVLDGVISGLEKQAPGALCSVLLLDDDGIHLRHGSAPSLPDEYNCAVDGIAIGPAVGSCGTAVYDNRQVIVSDIATDPLWTAYREFALRHGLRACWSTPIHSSQGRILGTFAIYYRTARHPAPEEQELIARAVGITRIAIERKHSEAALKLSEEKFRTLFEIASDAIFLLQGEQFVDCNESTLQMFGCESRDQIVGHPPYEFSPPLQPNGRESREFAIEKINDALAGHPQFFEWLHTKLDGTPFPAEVSLSKVDLGSKVLLQAIVRDITKRKKAEEEIRELNADLERRVEQRTSELRAVNKELEAFSHSLAHSNKDLEQFAYIASHDLQEPLRAVTGFCQLLEQRYSQGLNEEAREFIHFAVEGAGRMSELINGLLEYSRVGTRGAHLDVVGLNQVVDGALTNLQVAIQEAGAVVHCGELPSLAVDRLQMIRLFQNLIGNAIKYRSASPPVIDIAAESNADEWLFSIRDNGIGFDPRHAQRIFLIFQRLHTRSKYPGTGIGLAICERIVQRHGGRIWAESSPGLGSTFFFTLPHNADVRV